MEEKRKLSTITKDIRFWIILFFCIRLIGISNPPLETGHNWRQSLTAMIARNFVETDANMLYPRIDMAGNETGIIGSEFPFFNYLIYLCSLIFGYEHWYGRLINLVVSSFGIMAFCRILEKIFSPKIAYNAGLVLLSSIWFAFSRKIMPDTFSVSLVLIGLNFLYDYLMAGSKIKLTGYFIFCTLGMLCKIPSLSLFAVISVLFLVRNIQADRKNSALLLGGLSLVLVLVWYFYWVPYLVENYHYQLYFPKGIAEGFYEIIPLAKKFFAKFYFDALSSFIALVFFLAGLYFLLKEQDKKIIAGVTIMSTIFLFFTIKTGAVFPLHNYYIIPFVPIMAGIAGYGLSKLKAKHLSVFLLLICCEGILNQQHDFFISSKALYKLSLENKMLQYTDKNDLIVINGGDSPQSMYFAHRKGWTVKEEDLQEQKLQELKSKGAAYLVIDQHYTNKRFDQLPLVFENVDFLIYRL
jgi:hypothetical protein